MLCHLEEEELSYAGTKFMHTKKEFEKNKKNSPIRI